MQQDLMDLEQRYLYPNYDNMSNESYFGQLFCQRLENDSFQWRESASQIEHDELLSYNQKTTQMSSRIQNILIEDRKKLDIESRNLNKYQSVEEDLFTIKKIKQKKKRLIKKNKERDNPKEKKITVKNILFVLRKLLQDYFEENASQINSDLLVEFLTSKSTNMSVYESIFRDNQLRPVLEKMFKEHYLQRAIQHSRTTFDQLCVYMRKIRVIERAFFKQQFKRI